jgi:hypothetical protein
LQVRHTGLVHRAGKLETEVGMEAHPTCLGDPPSVIGGCR